MASLYLDPHAVISAWEEMGSDSWCDLAAPSGAASIALDLSGVEAALKAGSPSSSSPTHWGAAAAAAGGRGSGGGAGGLALVPDCPLGADSPMPQASPASAAAGAGKAPAAASTPTAPPAGVALGATGVSRSPVAWFQAPWPATLVQGAPQHALVLAALAQGQAGRGAHSGTAAAGGGATALTTGGFYTPAAAAPALPQGRPLIIRQVSGASAPPASAATAGATLVRSGGALYLLPPLQLQYAPVPVKQEGHGGQTSAPTASRSSSFEMALVPDNGRRQGPSCSGQSDSSSQQGGLRGSSSGGGWRSNSSSGGGSAETDGSPAAAAAGDVARGTSAWGNMDICTWTSAPATAGEAAGNSPTSAAAAAASLAMGGSSCSPPPSSPGSPASPRGERAVTRRPGLVTRRLAAAAAAAALGASGSAPGLPTEGGSPLGSLTNAATPAAAGAVTSTPGGHPADAGMREVYARARAECLARYRAKKARRRYTNTVRYHARKVNADRRPRIKGRFVKKEELALMGWEDLEGGDADVDLEMLSQQAEERYSSHSRRAAAGATPAAAATAAAAAAAVVRPNLAAAAPAAVPPPPAAAAAAVAVPPPAAAAAQSVAAPQVQDDLVVGDFSDADLLFDDMDMGDLDLLDEMGPDLVSDLLYYC